MKEITEELPDGVILSIEGELGTQVHYVDKNHEIRTFPILKGRFVPKFMLFDVGPHLIHTLKKALLEHFPNAQEIRLYKKGDWIFLCSVEALHE